MAYFVRIEDPKKFRLDLLEDSKKVIGNLQAVRSVLYVRQQKRQALESLRDQIKEIGLLITELDKMLPEKQLRQEAAAAQRSKELANESSKSSKKRSTKKKAKKDDPSPKEEPQPVDEEDKLAQALGAIERKLASLK